MAKRPLVTPIGSGYSVKHLDGGYFDPLASCKPLLWLVIKGGLQRKNLVYKVMSSWVEFQR